MPVGQMERPVGWMGETGSVGGDEHAMLERIANNLHVGCRSHEAADHELRRRPKTPVSRNGDGGRASLPPSSSVEDEARNCSATTAVTPSPSASLPLPNDEIAAEASRLGLDPACLAALPREMALEIIREEKTQRNRQGANEAASIRNDSSINGVDGDDNTASESGGSGREVSCPSRLDSLRHATGSVAGTSRLDPSQRPDQGQDLPSFSVPPGMDSDVFHGLPADVQRDVVMQHQQHSQQSSTTREEARDSSQQWSGARQGSRDSSAGSPSRPEAPPTTTHRPKEMYASSRNDDAFVIETMAAALDLSSAPLSRPSQRPPRRQMRSKKHFRSAIQALVHQNEQRLTDVRRLYEVSRVRTSWD